MNALVFPEEATIQLVQRTRAGDEPLALGGVVFAVRLRARHKNDYVLAPFVSDAEGTVRITREACECLVAAEHDSGLMDYAGVDQCSPEVEIWHLNEAETEAAADQRRRVWRQLLRGEDRLFASVAQLVTIYEAAPNRRLRAADTPVRAQWDGATPRPRYEYAILEVVSNRDDG